MKKRLPPLGRRSPSSRHILCNGGLSDIDAELEKLAMDPRCSPQRIGDAHLADKLAYFYRHGRSSAAVLRFPSPIRSKSRTAPKDYGLRSDDCKCPYILGNGWQTLRNINLSIETNRSLVGLARRSTLIWCLSTRISASSATCDRNRSLDRAILGQLPARLNLRQGQPRISIRTY